MPDATASLTGFLAWCLLWVTAAYGLSYGLGALVMRFEQ